MAVLYISEFSELTPTANGVAAVAQEPPLAEQTLAIAAGSVASLPFNPSTRFVRLHTDAVCSVEFGIAPTATATTARMAANQTEYFGVPRNAGYQVAVITNS
jgi:hypothetical protein